MAHYSTSKKVPGFTFLGPLMMVAGILMATDTGLRYALYPDMLIDEVSRFFAVSNFIIVAIFSFLLLHAGYLLFKGLIFSRYYAVIILFLCFLATSVRIYLFGFNPYPWKVIACAAVPILVILYLNQRQFRVRFEYKKGLAGVFLFFFWCFSIISAGYGALWVKNNWKDIPVYNQYKYTSNETHEISNYLPMGFSMKIPDNFHLSSIENLDSSVSVTFHNPDYGYIIMNNRSSIEPVYKRMKIIGFTDEFDFAKKFFHEKTGLIPLFIRKAMTSLKIKEFSEISVGELTIFMEKSSGDNAVAHIFSDRELIGEITVLSINQNDTGLYNELFRTMKKTEPPSDANKLYMDGVTHMTSQRLETAKRNFASAVAVNPKDAEFRYMLAETLALTGYVSSAKRQLEKCLEINPNHNRAEKLSEALSKLK
jgi:tetratricopeptide (TPR) repeat protein